MPFMSMTPSDANFMRAAAWFLVAATLCACASFSDDPRVRTPGAQIDDELLEKVIEGEIRQADPDLESSHLVVTSYNGSVLLIGQVPTEELRLKAQSITQGIAKVRQVHNEINVGGPTSHVARSNDRWLTTKVKTRLIGAEDVPGRKMKVQTENGVVYLIGLLTRAEADAAVRVTSEVFGVQKIVRIFDYLD